MRFEVRLGEEDLNEDYSFTFDSLADKEYEFWSLFMEPRITLREKFEELLVEEQSPISFSHRESIFESLKNSKFVYEEKIARMSEENLRLQRQLQMCQVKLFEIGMRHQE